MDHPDVTYIMAQLAQEFMKPDIQWFTADEARPLELDGQGYYHRLSAPGYLDCTEWTGPFDCEEEANSDLCDTYGDHIIMPVPRPWHLAQEPAGDGGGPPQAWPI